MSKRIAITVDEDMHGLLMKLADLRGETVSRIAGAILDQEREAWALEIAKWTVARRKEAEAEAAIEKLRGRSRTE